MNGMNKSELLKDPKVCQEIEKHKWFQSEKAGYDIGFDKAAEDWIRRYGKQWTKQTTSIGTKSNLKW
jgi:hypothetical protein